MIMNEMEAAMDFSFGQLMLVLFGLMVMQVIGTHWQVREYRRAVRRLHKLGNLGIGSRRRRLGPGNVVIIACDNEGRITGGEMMQGMTIFAHVHILKDVAGKTIYSLKAEYLDMPQKRRNHYKGHIQALDALEARLVRAAEEAEEKAVTDMPEVQA